MGTALADLVQQLQADIPARNGSPTAAQYEQAIKDAVADYSRRRPQERIATLQIVGGTAVYDLPTDFLFLICLDALTALDGVIHTASGLVPVATSWEERYSVNGKTITFVPTPGYTRERTLRYAAEHVLDDGAYPYLTLNDAAIVMLKAQAIALRLQAFSQVTAGSGEIVEYAIGDERVKKATPSERLSAAASSLESQYLEAVARATGTQGSRAHYTATGVLH